MFLPSKYHSNIVAGCFVFNVERLHLCLLEIPVENSLWVLGHMLKKWQRWILIFLRLKIRRLLQNRASKAGKPFFTSVLVGDPRRDEGVGYQGNELKPGINCEFAQVQITFRLKAQGKHRWIEARNKDHGSLSWNKEFCDRKGSIDLHCFGHKHVDKYYCLGNVLYSIWSRKCTSSTKEDR